MTHFDELVLEEVMHRTRAWETLQDAARCRELSTGELCDLMVRAGYPQEAVRRAVNQRGWERLGAGARL